MVRGEEHPVGGAVEEARDALTGDHGVLVALAAGEAGAGNEMSAADLEVAAHVEVVGSVVGALIVQDPVLHYPLIVGVVGVLVVGGEGACLGVGVEYVVDRARWD